MKTSAQKHKFIELRASGMSFEKISCEIDVSKPTLIKWSLEFKKEIENGRFLAIEALLDQHQLSHVTRIKSLSEAFVKAQEELNRRDLSLLSFKDLMGFINHLEEKLAKEGGALKYTTDQRSSKLTALLRSAPLRTVRDSFPSYGSNLSKAIGVQQPGYISAPFSAYLPGQENTLDNQDRRA